MEFQCADLPQPQECGQVVARDSGACRLCSKNGHRLDELRQRLRPVLLKKRSPLMPSGHANHGQRSIRKVRQHEACDAGEIADEIALSCGAKPRARSAGQ